MTLEPSSRKLTSFKLLSFDIYGTLIDWETGIHDALRSSPYFSSLQSSHPLASRSGLLKAVEKHEHKVQIDNPTLIYPKIQEQVFKATVAEFNLTINDDSTSLDKEATKFGQSVGHFPAFPDTVKGLQRLSKHYKLVPVSNVDNKSVTTARNTELAGVDFADIYTAEDIGSYKPDRRNFEYLLKHIKEDYGVEKDELLHVAQGLYHDHSPAHAMGLESVWVDRKGLMGDVEEGLREKAKFGWRVESIKELADLVDKAFAQEK